MTDAKKRALRIAGGIAGGVAALMLLHAYYRGTWTEDRRTTADGLVAGDVDSRLFLQDGRKWVQLAAVIDAPIAHVWKVVHDHERMTEFMPRMAKLRVLEEGRDSKKVRIDFGFLGVERFTEIDVTRVTGPAERVETWSRYGGSLPINRGRWVLVPIDEKRTFARYEVDADSGLWVPAWLERAILRDGLKVVLTKVGERIDKLRVTEPAYLDSAQ